MEANINVKIMMSIDFHNIDHIFSVYEKMDVREIKNKNTTKELKNCGNKEIKKENEFSFKVKWHRIMYELKKLISNVMTQAHATLSIAPPQYAAIKKPETVINVFKIPL